MSIIKGIFIKDGGKHECTQFAEIFEYRDIAYKSRKAKLNLDASTK
jgi:hypothetical protein